MNDQPKQKNPMVTLNDQFVDRTEQFKMALPKHIPPERFFRVVMTAVQMNPDLIACDRSTLFLSSLKCAQDGLLPDGREAALVPFKTKVQYLIMVGGLLKRFRNSGQFRWIGADVVYEGDDFEYFVDETGPHLKHVPSYGENSDRKIKCVYGAATTKEGAPFVRVLSIADINKRRAMSRASREDAPWKQWPIEMMQKTAIRVLSRLLPMSSDLDDLIRSDEDLYDFEDQGDAATQAIARSETATGAALDHFAAGLPKSEDEKVEPSTVEPPTGDDTKSPPPTSEDVLEIAREKGRQAKTAGQSRKSIPPEYRTASRQAEADAWYDGWEAGEPAGDAQEH